MLLLRWPRICADADSDSHGNHFSDGHANRDRDSGRGQSNTQSERHAKSISPADSFGDSDAKRNAQSKRYANTERDSWRRHTHADCRTDRRSTAEPFHARTRADRRRSPDWRLRYHWVEAKTVVIRAIGPSLSRFGVPGALADPILDLFDANQNLIQENDNWREGQEADIIASGIAPSDDRESAVILTLEPSAYTAVVSSSTGANGVGLIEVFDLDRAVGSVLG